MKQVDRSDATMSITSATLVPEVKHKIAKDEARLVEATRKTALVVFRLRWTSSPLASPQSRRIDDSDPDTRNFKS